jgi:hypothetical protein
MGDGDDVKRRVGLQKDHRIRESLDKDTADTPFVWNARHWQHVLRPQWKRAEHAFDLVNELVSKTRAFAFVPSRCPGELAQRFVIDEDGLRHR